MSARLGAPFPGIEPIEVWDRPVRGRPLQWWRESPTFAEDLASVAIGLRDAPPAAFRPAARAIARTIGRVHLVGGAADAPLAQAIAARGLPCTLTSDPFAAARAGASRAPGLRCVDVGQTAIKLVEGERVWRVARDLVRAPLRDTVPLAELEGARASTLAFLAEAIASGESAPRRILLGLPCERTDEGLPRGCTYAWRDPDAELIPSLEARTGAAIALANDAELGALAAALVLPPGPTALVLTIGFSVGGALLA